MEQLSGRRRLGFGAAVFEHRVDFRAILQEARTRAEALPEVCQGGIGEPPLGRPQRANLLGQRSIHRETRGLKSTLKKSRARN